jgi:hypothetical protein
VGSGSLVAVWFELVVHSANLGRTREPCQSPLVLTFFAHDSASFHDRCDLPYLGLFPAEGRMKATPRQGVCGGWGWLSFVYRAWKIASRNS